MYKAFVCTFINDEVADLKTDFEMVEVIGNEFATRKEAVAAAKVEADRWTTEVVNAYCKDVDGVCFDVIDHDGHCVDSYELMPGGYRDEWHEFECHEEV